MLNTREQDRATKRAAVTRELMLVSLLSRVWPSHLAAPRRPQAAFTSIVCIHSPAGPLVWRLSDEELPLFAHLERGPNHAKDYQAGEKEAVLLDLATDPTFVIAPEPQ